MVLKYLHNGLDVSFKLIQKEDSLLPAILERFCQDIIGQNSYENCAKKLYGIIPDDGVCDQELEEEDE